MLRHMNSAADWRSNRLNDCESARILELLKEWLGPTIQINPPEKSPYKTTTPQTFAQDTRFYVASLQNSWWNLTVRRYPSPPRKGDTSSNTHWTASASRTTTTINSAIAILSHKQSTPSTSRFSINLIPVDTFAGEVCWVLVFTAVVVAVPINLEGCSAACEEGYEGRGGKVHVELWLWEKWLFGVGWIWGKVDLYRWS